ncbi:MAG TPA: hypothetical protein VFW77_05235 [Candidatus Saccharimonadales bacterium]|nr:hypothetical protein [Candidatus Saccharimonadales bacterium]
MNLKKTASGIQYKWNHLRPQSLHFYLKGRSHRKIGAFATSRYFQFVNMVSRDINMLAGELNMSAMDISDSMASIVSRPYVHPLENEKTADREEKRRDRLDEAVRQSNEMLAEATTVFPFTLFPDTVTLDRKKLVITQRSFFMTGKVLSIQIEEILNISVNVGPFFGSLHIAIRGLTSEDHFDVSYLWRKDAIHLKHMIEGYIIAKKEEIKTGRMQKEELIHKLVKLGSDSNPERL